jgi:quercetin dioxygenase-like cupin family protein
MQTLAMLLGALLLVQPASSPPLPDPLQAGWKGKPACERLLENDRQRVLRCTFAPGAGHERHFHRPHVGYALQGGRMRITDGSGMREAVLATGSTFSSDGVGWHEVLNIGDTTVQYLIVESKDRAEAGK